MITSEAVPYAKSGGLADVVTSLSYSLTDRGYDVRIIIPNYGNIQHAPSSATSPNLSVSWGIDQTESFSYIIEKYKNITWYFIDNPLFCERKGIYGETSHTPYPDNLYRFSFFSYAVFKLLKQEEWIPDIMHCHDWTTGFIPSLAKSSDFRDFNETKSLLTIHNLGYQGIFPRLDIVLTGFSRKQLFKDSVPKQNSQINMLSTGILHADWITTVSENYAEEIKTPEFGHGLEYLLQSRAENLTGILNGVDYEDWSPEKDQFIPQTYSMQTIHDKKVNKIKLQQEFGLKEIESIPIFGIISRIADQKGFIELLQGSPCVLERIADEFDIQLVIVGTGDQELEKKLLLLDKKYDTISVKITFNDYLAHLIEAGADFFLMPSRYEPCGLNQIYSLRYGTLPIVHATGGLKDTVDDIEISPDDIGTGIVFSELSPESIYEALVRGIQLYVNSPDKYLHYVANAMQKDFSWERATKQYENIYSSKGVHYDE
ncbi:MAG: glycogen synthase [Spirochaetia bacterium]|nr:glycogen synthase [Spirochaetia bacterium]